MQPGEPQDIEHDVRLIDAIPSRVVFEECGELNY